MDWYVALYELIRTKADSSHKIRNFQKILLNDSLGGRSSYGAQFWSMTALPTPKRPVNSAAYYARLRSSAHIEQAVNRIVATCCIIDGLICQFFQHGGHPGKGVYNRQGLPPVAYIITIIIILYVGRDSFA